MSATRLLVLAFVRACGRAHGYRVGQELLAWRADQWANTKTGSIYHALRQLGKEGLLREYEVPATEAVPGRTDYEITEAGDREFHRMMEKALTVPDTRPDTLCAGLVLMSALPRATVLGYLRIRLEGIDRMREETNRARPRPETPPHVEALIGFWDHTLASSQDWLRALIARIEGGAYVFADEDPRVFGMPGTSISLR